MKCDGGVSDCVPGVSDSELGLCNGGNYLARAAITQSVLRIPRYCDTPALPGITPGYSSTQSGAGCPGARAESCPLQTLITDHRLAVETHAGPGCHIAVSYQGHAAGKERGREGNYPFLSQICTYCPKPVILRHFAMHTCTVPSARIAG